MSAYTPLIKIDGEPADVGLLEKLCQSKGVTHVRALNGKVWKTYTWLNRKSVPLNHAGIGPSRLPWLQVESLGVLEEES